MMKALVERVKEVVTYVPERCGKCDQPLSKEAGAKDPEPKRHQVAELPKVAAEITEHQGHARRERVLRRAVLWRRRSFGCHSDAGCRFVERILTWNAS